MTKIVRRLDEKEKKIVGEKYKWITLEDFPFKLKCGKRGVVPKGFVCDGASGPGIDCLGVEDWLVHDWLYATAGHCKLENEKFMGDIATRYEADSVFGWSYIHRWLAVRACAEPYWGADRKDFNGIAGSADDPIHNRIIKNSKKEDK